VGGAHDSSLTRVQPVFGSALSQDQTGAAWLARLLRAAPLGPTALAGLVHQPGLLAAATVEPSQSKKAPLRCFEQNVQPDRRLLSWCIEHPERLIPPSLSDHETSSGQRRIELIHDNVPGSRVKRQREARACVAAEPVDRARWWRFERATEIDCVLATDRLVLCIEGKRDERLQKRTKWLSGRHQLARTLEAAWRLAGAGRAFAVLLCVERTDDPLGDPATLAESLEQASPHLFAAERSALAQAYLGALTWTAVCEALRLDPADLPRTVDELPRTLRPVRD
jgi:hypothetical protein